LESRRIASQDPKPGSISSLRCHKSRTRVPVKDAACEAMFSRTMFVPIGSGQSLYSARLRSFELRRGSLRYDRARRAVAGTASEVWWSQTGSNRRPHACKARALPAELWPRTRKRNASSRVVALAFARATAQQPSFKTACRAEAAEQRRLVGLGRLELPTSRLSSARSNQLSYKPLTLILHRFNSRDRGSEPCPRIGQAPIRAPSRAPDASHKQKALVRVRPRRKRNEDGEIPPMELNNPETVGP
jgi:hypothetical protein